MSFFKKITKQCLGVSRASRLKSKYSDFKYRSWSITDKGRENHLRLSRLKGIHRGKRAFVIGNGPSLRKTNLVLLRNEITIGSNGIFLLQDEHQFKPMYHTIEDRLVGEDRKTEAQKFQGPQKIYPYDLRYCLGGISDAIFVNFDRRAQIQRPIFSGNALERIFWGGTVTFMNLQLAWYLGCDPVYLIGVDHSYQDKFSIKKDGSVWTSQEDDQNHFDPRYFGKGYRWHDPNVARMEQAYEATRAFAEENNWNVLNATIGGKLEVFDRVNYEEIFTKNG